VVVAQRHSLRQTSKAAAQNKEKASTAEDMALVLKQTVFDAPRGEAMTPVEKLCPPTPGGADKGELALSITNNRQLRELPTLPGSIQLRNRLESGARE
jgi:hypothetical protein